MNDPELIELRNRWLLALGVAVVMSLPLFIFVFKTYNSPKYNILNDIINKKSEIIFVEDKKCNNCKEIKEILKQNNIYYKILYLYKSPDIDKICSSLGIKENVLTSPGIIYLNEGELHSYLFNIKSIDDVNKYIEFNNLNYGYDG